MITAAIFWAWYRREGPLSIHSINTRRRERFYWAAVLATFALGTAAGDLTAMSLSLGYWVSVVLFALIIAIPAVMWWRGTMHPIAAFWFAYVVTRPLGASFADGFSKPILGGLRLGDGMVSAIALVVFIALVGYVASTRRDVQGAAEQVPPGTIEEREAVAFGLTPAAEIGAPVHGIPRVRSLEPPEKRSLSFLLRPSDVHLTAAGEPLRTHSDRRNPQMLAIIVLNVVFAAIVVVGIVGLLARSVWTSRTDVAVHPARSHATRQVTRRRLASVTG